MSRSYSLPTIKTLFAEASVCAFPGCDVPLIFRDRGATTAVADIAHIRSASLAGPRHDPTYTGDVDGPENLLLLCGIHHRPVDRHESLYSIDELLAWKAAQRAQAGPGISLTEADVRAYTSLSAEERAALAQLARLVERLTSKCEQAHAEIELLRARNEDARSSAASRFGPIYEVDEEGNRSTTPLSTDSFRLSHLEQSRWDDQIRQALQRHSGPVLDAVMALSEESAVLRMQSPGLRPWLERLRAQADDLVKAVGQARVLTSEIDAIVAAVDTLWAAATGTTEDPGAPS